MEDFSDEELVDQYRRAAGTLREDFLNRLFERHHLRVAAWCFRITGDSDAATDLAQEVFLKAFQHLDSFRGQSKFTTWLYAIARNRCMDALHSRANTPERAEDGVLERMVDARTLDCLTAMEQRQSQELLRRLIQESLDATEIQVLTMHYAQEIPLEAVTRLLGLQNASGAKANIVSARRKLARALTAWNEQEQRRKDSGHVKPANC